MHSRWFNIAVVALWLTTMSWLVSEKILPSLVVGDPPDRAAILRAQAEEKAVDYEIRWQNERIGHASIEADRTASGATLVDGRIRFRRVPIRQLVPGGLLEWMEFDDSLPDDLRLDATSSIHFHASGQLQHFESKVTLSPRTSLVHVEGFVAGEVLLLTIRSAGSTYRSRRPLPGKAVVRSALMPQTRMPGLRDGQKWTIEMYNPLRPRTDPMEVVLAEVVGREPISWNGRIENTRKVVYRGDPGNGNGRGEKELAWLWVCDDGVVLQHRIAILGGTLTFIRMPDRAREELRADR